MFLSNLAEYLYLSAILLDTGTMALPPLSIPNVCDMREGDALPACGNPYPFS